MREALTKRGIKFRDSKVPIIAIYTYEPEVTLVACKRLFEEVVYVNPVLPPATPAGQCLIRTSYTATHTKELIDEAADKILKVFKELEIIK